MKREFLLNTIAPFWKVYNRLKAPLLSYPKSGNGFEAVSRVKMVQYNKVRIYGAKPLFCYNPFVNIFFNINGDAIACCRSHETVLGKYPNQSIKEIWFGKRYDKMREHMLHNDLNMGCNYCKMQLESMRFHALPSLQSEEYVTAKKTAYPKTMELELSNVCNLQCVMCSGRVSSAIRRNREKLPPIKSPYDDEFVEQLKSFLPHLKTISFFGGEPFLIDIYYKIWDQIVLINPKIKIFVVTNGTIYNQRIELLLKKLNFNITISIDSLEKEKFEKIRVGAKFENVMQNIENFVKHTNGKLIISHTPMKLNWMDTPEIVNFCNKRDLGLNLSYVEKPAKYALWTYSPNELDKIVEFYENFIIQVQKYSYKSDYNITVFNEWKEQVKYFRDKNKEILSEIGSLEVKYAALKKEVESTFVKFYKNVPDDWMSFDDAYTVLKKELFEISRSPVQVEGMNLLLERIENVTSVSQPKVKALLTNKAEFTKFIRNLVSEDRFWERYY